MDIRLQEALDFSNYRLTLSTQLENLKIKLASDLIVTHANGIFTASQDRLLFVESLVRNGVSSFYVLDDNHVPIQITDLADFYKLLYHTHTTAMTAYAEEYTKVSKSRNIKKIVDYNG